MTVAELANLLAEASPVFLFALFIAALLRRWLVLPRELDQCETRISELEREKDEYKGMVMRSLNLGERVAQVAEERRE